MWAQTKRAARAPAGLKDGEGPGGSCCGEGGELVVGRVVEMLLVRLRDQREDVDQLLGRRVGEVDGSASDDAALSTSACGEFSYVDAPVRLVGAWASA